MYWIVLCMIVLMSFSSTESCRCRAFFPSSCTVTLTIANPALMVMEIFPLFAAAVDVGGAVLFAVLLDFDDGFAFGDFVGALDVGFFSDLVPVFPVFPSKIFFILRRLTSSDS